MSHHLIWKLLGVVARITKDNYLRNRANSPVDPGLNCKRKSWEYFLSGNEKLERGDYLRAVRAYDKAIALDSERQNYFIYRGIAKANGGDKEGAMQDYGKARDLDKWGIMKNDEKAKELAGLCQDSRKDSPVQQL